MGRASGDSYVAPQARLENPLSAPEAQPVDEVVAAEVAANAASAAQLLVSTNAINRADTLDAQVKLATKTDEATTAVVEKPTLVTTDSDSSAGIITITVKKGDSLASLSQEYGISVNTIRWANNIDSGDVKAGQKLVILPVTGLLHTVESGDTAQSLAGTYKASAAEITAYNDIEVKGLKPGSKIVIPNGQKPAETSVAVSTPTPVASTPSTSTVTGFGGSLGAQTVGNRYAYGYCTYYAYNKRAAAGRPVGSFWGNATTWASYAAASGYAVDNNPRAGDVFQTSGGWGGYGHVGYVEKVLPNGSVLVSEMNYAGWNVISSRTLSASEARSYNFIH